MPVVETKHGGSAGDGADLTPFGSDLVAGPAVAGIARVEENNASVVDRFLNCSERADTRIGPTPLHVFHSDFGKIRRLSQLGLRPIERPAGCAALSRRGHSHTRDEHA